MMQGQRLYFLLFICLLAALSVGFGELQDSKSEKVLKNGIETAASEKNTEVSHEEQDKLNSSTGVGSSTTKPSSPLDSNAPKVNQSGTKEEGSTIGASEQGKRTRVIDPISVKIIRAEENGICFSDMMLNKVIPFKNISHIKTFSADYHYEKRLVFYAANDMIYRDEVFGSKMTSGSSSPIVLQGVDGPMSLAVDWVHDKLYWFSNRHSSVECAALDGSNRTVLIDSFVNTDYPNNIAVDPYEGFLFVVSNHSIYRSPLTGSHLTHISILGDGTRAVKGISVDTHKKRIYFTGKDGHPKTGEPYVASCNYEGMQVQEVSLNLLDLNDIFSIAVFRDILYFAHYPKNGPDTIWSVDLTKTPLNPLQKYSTEEGLWSIKVYHPKVQKRLEEID